MAYAPLNGDLILGQFVEVEYGEAFEYTINDASIMASRRPGSETINFPHKIHVGHGETRYALVCQTVAYVIIDEGEGGQWIVQKWEIKKHRKYDLDKQIKYFNKAA